MAAETKLLPCPFCGSDDVRDVDNLFRHVFCRGCLAYLMAVEGSPAEAWNRRVPPVSPEESASGDAEVPELSAPSRAPTHATAHRTVSPEESGQERERWGALEAAIYRLRRAEDVDEQDDAADAVRAAARLLPEGQRVAGWANTATSPDFYGFYTRDYVLAELGRPQTGWKPATLILHSGAPEDERQP